MQKFDIIVPSDIRYISEWQNYRLENYPYPHILNKVITGCGYTEYCITNNQNLVLCSPRKLLLTNKMRQHSGELNVMYARNDFDIIVDYEKDLSVAKSEINSVINTMSADHNAEAAKKILELKNKIRNHCDLCQHYHEPFKILVTYDSFRHVKEVLQELGLLQDTQVVIDEFQSILIDARFKSSNELELLHNLKDLNKVCFVSATPMLDKYLDQIDEFKNLPYFQFDWKTQDPGRVKKPVITVKLVKRSLSEELKKIIIQYRSGKFDRKIYVDLSGKSCEIFSREAVFFFNSVADICSAIKKNKLLPNETNILCADTSDNEKKVKEAFNKVIKELFPDDKSKKLTKADKAIGTIPVKGEPHKMFTFCTRTVYLGADFYSTCARTFVFSDSNIDCLAVDISMDLEQILGRQRLDENPWKNTANLYIKTTKKKYTRAEFDERLKQKIDKSNYLLDAFSDIQGNDRKNAVAETYERDAAATNYKYNYVAVNNHAGLGKVPVFNNIVYVAEIRAFEIQQQDYKDRFTVFNAINNTGLTNTEITDVDECINQFNSNTQFIDKMKCIEAFEKELDPGDFYLFLKELPEKIKDYVNLIGLKKIKALKYCEADLEREWSRRVNNCSIDDELKEKIYSSFEVGKRYTKAFIKEELEKIYEEIGYKATPKAIELEKYFKTKYILLTNKETGKRDAGFEILEKLD